MVPTGFEKAIESMTKGEKADFLVKSSYGYSTWGNVELGVEMDTDLRYEITLVDFTKGKETWELEKSEKVDAALRLKTQGNNLFKLGRINPATLRYTEALELIKYETSLEGDLQQSADAIRLSCNLNMAACKLKTQDYAEAKEACDEALQLDAMNVKAMYRRGQALFQMANFEEAMANVQQGLQVDSSNANLKVLGQNIRRKLREMKEKERKVFGGIFNRKTPAPVVKASGNSDEREEVQASS